MRTVFPEKSISVVLDPMAQMPLHKQLYEGLRRAILRRQLPIGIRLPSTRAFAHELGISRTTVQLAFEQLIAEGYLDGRRGSGIYVAASFPSEELEEPAKNSQQWQPESGRRAISERGKV